jgi:hypothetical protein
MDEHAKHLSFLGMHKNGSTVPAGEVGGVRAGVQNWRGANRTLHRWNDLQTLLSLGAHEELISRFWSAIFDDKLWESRGLIFFST